MNPIEKLKKRALVKFLGCDDGDVMSEGDGLFTYGDKEYLVYDDNEADVAVAAYCRDTAWAFNVEFLLDHMSIDWNAANEKSVRAVTELCESGNEVIVALIDDFDEFVNDAVKADGRGHFLDGYDGTEESVEVEDETGKETYYIYRVN